MIMICFVFICTNKFIFTIGRGLNGLFPIISLTGFDGGSNAAGDVLCGVAGGLGEG